MKTSIPWENYYNENDERQNNKSIYVCIKRYLVNCRVGYIKYIVNNGHMGYIKEKGDIILAR